MAATGQAAIFGANGDVVLDGTTIVNSNKESLAVNQNFEIAKLEDSVADVVGLKAFGENTELNVSMRPSVTAASGTAAAKTALDTIIQAEGATKVTLSNMDLISLDGDYALTGPISATFSNRDYVVLNFQITKYPKIAAYEATV